MFTVLLLVSLSCLFYFMGSVTLIAVFARLGRVDDYIDRAMGATALALIHRDFLAGIVEVLVSAVLAWFGASPKAHVAIVWSQFGVMIALFLYCFQIFWLRGESAKRISRTMRQVGLIPSFVFRVVVCLIPPFVTLIRIMHR